MSEKNRLSFDKHKDSGIDLNVALVDFSLSDTITNITSSQSHLSLQNEVINTNRHQHTNKVHTTTETLRSSSNTFDSFDIDKSFQSSILAGSYKQNFMYASINVPDMYQFVNSASDIETRRYDPQNEILEEIPISSYVSTLYKDLPTAYFENHQESSKLTTIGERSYVSSTPDALSDGYSIDKLQQIQNIMFSEDSTSMISEWPNEETNDEENLKTTEEENTDSKIEVSTSENNSTTFTSNYESIKNHLTVQDNMISTTPIKSVAVLRQMFSPHHESAKKGIINIPRVIVTKASPSPKKVSSENVNKTHVIKVSTRGREIISPVAEYIRGNRIIVKGKKFVFKD